MNIRHTLIPVILLVLLSVPAIGQQYDDWEGYTSMYRMSSVLVYEGMVYGASTHGLFRYDPETREYRFYYKNNGLEKRDILTIEAVGDYIYLGLRQDGLFRFDPANETFKQILFPEYYNSSDITKSIAVNDIVALNDSILYIAHSKGIDRLDLENEEVRTYERLSTFTEQLEVTQLTLYDGNIWACTIEGLAWASISDPNLESYTAWQSTRFSNDSKKVTAVLPFSETGTDTMLYVGTENRGVVIFDPATGDTTHTMEKDIQIEHLVAGLGTIVAATRNRGILVRDGDGWLQDDTNTDTKWIAAEGDDTVWVATRFDGVMQYQTGGYVEIPVMNMPTSPTIMSLSLTADNILWASTSDQDGGGKVQRFEDGQWHSYRSLESVFMNKTVGVHVDSRGTVWGVSWGEPIYTIDDGGTMDPEDDKAASEDENMELILTYLDGTTYVVSPAITEDRHGNIWIAGFSRGAYLLSGDTPITEHPSAHFTFEDSGISNYYVNTVTTDPDGWVWLGTLNTGLFCLKTGPDPYDPSDDIRKYIRGGSNSDGLYGSRVRAVAVDHDDDVWVGTDAGLNRISKKSNDDLEVYEANELLDVVTTEVFALEVDEMNNKWIGTIDGLYKVNEENELVARYTEANSGLLSNKILSLLYDTNEDRMLIGSDAGLNAFYLFGTGSETELDDAHVYPNPFELWGTDSRVTFTSLAKNEPLRIYTFNGELVTELTPDESDGRDGAQVAWDGTNDRGELVGSGVFFFTGTNRHGKEFRDKLAVVRR